MKPCSVAFLVSLTASSASPAGAQSPPLSPDASSVALAYWKELKAGGGNESQYIAADATFGMMGLRGWKADIAVGTLASKPKTSGLSEDSAASAEMI